MVDCSLEDRTLQCRCLFHLGRKFGYHLELVPVQGMATCVCHKYVCTLIWCQATLFEWILLSLLIQQHIHCCIIVFQDTPETPPCSTIPHTPFHLPGTVLRVWLPHHQAGKYWYHRIWLEMTCDVLGYHYNITEFPIHVDVPSIF